MGKDTIWIQRSEELYGKTEEEQTDKLTKVVDAQIRIQREQDQG